MKRNVLLNIKKVQDVLLCFIGFNNLIIRIQI